MSRNNNRDAARKAFAEYQSGSYVPHTHSSIRGPAPEYSTSSGNDVLLSIKWFFSAALVLAFNILAPIEMGIDSLEWENQFAFFCFFPLTVIFFTLLGIRYLQQHLRRKKQVRASSYKPHRKRRQKAKRK